MTIAIVIPTYNCALTISDTLRSVLDQSRLCAVSAVYVADDGSDDDTVALAERVWSRRDVPLQVLKRERNLGQWRNANRTLCHVSLGTDWIAILHGDDIAKPYWIEEMLAAIQTAPDSVASVCSSWDVLFPNGSVTTGEENPARGIEHIRGTSEAIRSTLLRGCWWHISGACIRSAALRQIGDFREALPQMADWEWLLRCLCAGLDVLYIPRTLILYRQHGASVSSASFRVHRDVRESFHIIHQYARYLSPSDLAYLYRRRFIALAKRTGVSVARRDFRRAGSALSLMTVVPYCFLRSLLAARPFVDAKS